MEQITVTSYHSNGFYNLIDGKATAQMSAAVLPANATNAQVEWSVSPAETATVNADGQVTATAAGTYTVTATAKDGSGVTGSANIEVLDTSGLPAWTMDAETKSGWVDKYGKDGYVLCGWDGGRDLSDLPYYITSVTYLTQDRSGGYVARNADTAGNETWWEYGLPTDRKSVV